MEQNEPLNEPLFTFLVEAPAQRSLLSAGSWTRFLAILGFICMGLLVIAFLFAGATIFSSIAALLPGMEALAGLAVLFAVILLAIIGVLSFLLLRGSNLVKKGIYSNDQAVFNAGLASYRTYFLLYGILSIVSLLFNIYELFI
jgi:hypothetical protein